MDEQVRAALAKWPDVPDCTGWLALDARGRWRIGEAKAGPRQPITHGAMNAFINRNYAAQGRFWTFQNGPQRVYVELEYTPYVWRLVPREAGRADDAWDLVAHTGVAMTPTSAWLDGDGRFLFEAKSPEGSAHAPVVGVLHDHDAAIATELLRDRTGAVLDDETLSRLSTGSAGDASDVHAATAMDGVRLHWPAVERAMPLQRIASHQVPLRFGFEPRPAAALRVDLDTRR